MSDYMDQKPWSRLKSGNVFQGAFVENGTVAWPGNVDIDPETLYEQSLPFSDSSLKITQAVKASGCPAGRYFPAYLPLLTAG